MLVLTDHILTMHPHMVSWVMATWDNSLDADLITHPKLPTFNYICLSILQM